MRRKTTRVFLMCPFCVRGVLLKLTTNAVHVTVELHRDRCCGELRSSTTAALRRGCLLLAGGFAPPYLEEPYDGKVMQPLRESLRRLLDAHQPNPALIVHGLWNLIEANAAASLLWDGVDPALLEAPINMLRLAVHPDGLPGISSMTAACNTPLIHQLRRKSRDDADAALAELVDELESYLPAEPPDGSVHQPVVSLDLQTRLGDVSLFTVIANLGAPLGVTAANLAIETFLPMDTESATRLRELAKLPDQDTAVQD